MWIAAVRSTKADVSSVIRSDALKFLKNSQSRRAWLLVQVQFVSSFPSHSLGEDGGKIVSKTCSLRGFLNSGKFEIFYISLGTSVLLKCVKSSTASL